MENEQRQQKKFHDSAKPKLQEFSKNDRVQVKDFSGNAKKWDEGIIESRLGPLMYQVNVHGKSKKIHVDHLLAQQTDITEQSNNG